MNKLERRSINAVVRAESVDGVPHFVGYGIRFEELSKDLGGFYEIIDRDAVVRTLADATNDYIASYNHDYAQILGRRSAGTLSVTVDDEGVFYDITSPETTYANDLQRSIQLGNIRSSSFSFYDQDRKLDGQHNGKPVVRLLDIDVIEFAPVVFPAYESANGLIVSPGRRSYIETLATDGTGQAQPPSDNIHAESMTQARLLAKRKLQFMEMLNRHYG